MDYSKMKKEEIENNNFDTQKDLCEALVGFQELKLASEEEKRDWEYKSDLFISLENVVGKFVFVGEVNIGKATRCFFGKSGRGQKSVRVKTDLNKEISITDAKIQIYDRFSKKNVLVKLHPSRGGVKFWSHGYIISEKDYKSLYYKTREYRDSFNRSLNENYGVTGMTSPVQIKEIRDKISKTIENKYGVKWFLERGCHYSAVTISMQEKFGVDNLFYSDEWQLANAKKVNKNFGETSKLEREIIAEISKEVSGDSFFKKSPLGQKILVINKNKFYKIDYYNEEYNIVIEVMGDYWHCNPLIYENSFYHKNKNKYASEIWKDDRKRKNEIINILKCNFIEIWENDWKENRENIIIMIKNIVESYENI
jgi:hypothetical protein